jgi:probable rRNA maturation factor
LECEVPPAISEISIVITDDASIRELNKSYRKKDKATDILSFSQLDIRRRAFMPPTLGDLVISLDTAVKQAKKYKHSLMKELERLLIHGTLHLLGYDHEKVSKSIAEKMRRKEKVLLSLCS